MDLCPIFNVILRQIQAWDRSDVDEFRVREYNSNILTCIT